MSDDILERLRTAKGSVRHGPMDDGSYSLSLLNNVDLCHEAANEIERLRADLAVANSVNRTCESLRAVGMGSTADMIEALADRAEKAEADLAVLVGVLNDAAGARVGAGVVSVSGHFFNSGPAYEVMRHLLGDNR